MRTRNGVDRILLASGKGRPPLPDTDPRFGNPPKPSEVALAWLISIVVLGLAFIGYVAWDMR